MGGSGMSGGCSYLCCMLWWTWCWQNTSRLRMRCVGGDASGREVGRLAAHERCARLCAACGTSTCVLTAHNPTARHLSAGRTGAVHKLPLLPQGPPRPPPPGFEGGDSLGARLHTLLDGFEAAPFTLQRLCEVLLEPRKQYARLDKVVSAAARSAAAALGKLG